MPRKEKVPKVHKNKSRTITKKTNQSAHNPSYFKSLSQAEKNQVLAGIQGTPDFKRLYDTLNPSDKQYVDMNLGNPEPGEAKFLKGKKPHLEKISNLTPEQSRAAYSFLEQTIPEAFLSENATQQQIQAAREQGLGGTLAALGQPYESPLNTQLNNMFGHMANPVMQAFLNPERGNEARGSLFPDRIEQQYNQGQHQQQQENNPLRQLVGALGQHAYQQQAVPWLNQLTPEDVQQGYGYIEPGLNRAYEGVQNAYQGAGNMAGNAYGGIQNLLSKLGSYIPKRGQQQGV